MDLMNRRRRLLLAAAFACTTFAQAQLNKVQTIYLLPMAGGLDQYLATRLVERHLFNVVTDPQRADAILVDRIGEGLEEKLAELYPDQVKKAEKDAADKDKKQDGGPQRRVGSTNLQRGKGTFFIVDRHTHTVLWSVYSPSRSTRTGDINRNAESIAKKLALAMKEAKP